MRRSNQGFTLIEIMIVIAIIGIVITIGYPKIAEHVKKPHRTEIALQLSEQAQVLERFHSKNGVYTNATGLSAGNDYYSIVPTLTDQTFSLTAERKSGSMMDGDRCGDVTLTNTGAITPSNVAAGLNTEDCWSR